MHPRRLTRPVNMLTFVPRSYGSGAASVSELVPLRERWRPMGRRLRQYGENVARLLRRGWTLSAECGKRIGRVASLAAQRLGPIIARGLHGTYRASQGLRRTATRSWRVVRRRARLYGRTRRTSHGPRSNDEVLRTLDGLTREVQALHQQIQTQQALLLHFATRQDEGGTDAAWVARALASAQPRADRGLPRHSSPRATLETRRVIRRENLQLSDK